MGEQTAIAWTDSTFNPWWGCTKVSPGCDHCYAEAFDKRVGGSHWGPRAPRKVMSDSHWRKPPAWDRAAKKAGTRRRVFCASMADWADNAVPGDWRERLWDVIRATPSLDWQLLTKRPQNVAKMLPADWSSGYPNVWLGTTVENATEAARRVPHLQAVPAKVRFLSCEPLIEAIRPDLSGIHWVIVGGESGGGARPYRPEWARGLLAQCRTAGVAFFHKQAGSRREGWPGATGKGENPAEWPVELRVQEFPP